MQLLYIYFDFGIRALFDTFFFPSSSSIAVWSRLPPATSEAFAKSLLWQPMQWANKQGSKELPAFTHM